MKAFDKVPHEWLKIKLTNHGIDGPVLDWIVEWLSHRKQKVRYNGNCSGWADVNIGVPQGSALGAIIYITKTKIWKRVY